MIICHSYQELRNHLSVRQITVITGMRRVGKSTALQYLLQQSSHKTKLYLDCERVEVRNLFNRPDYKSIAEELQLMGLDMSEPGLLALDEIQLVEHLPSFIKYVYDTHKIKIIVTGSSSFYMKNKFSESLAGRKRIFEMYPLSFREFLQFKKVSIKEPEKYAWQPFNRAWYNRCKDLYEEYIRFGGFPEVALQQTKKIRKHYSGILLIPTSN